MKYISTGLLIIIIALYTAFAWALPTSYFTSVHQYAGSYKASWTPDGRTSYRNNIVSNPPARFKVYIPAGTEYAVIMSNVAQGNGLIFQAVARIGQPPDAMAYVAGQPLAQNGYRLSELNKDCFIQNSGGYLQIVNSAGMAPTTTGQWLYVDVYRRDSAVQNIKVTVQVDPTAYKKWYDSAQWESNGDPVEGNVVVTPTPKPTPAPIPTPVFTPTPTPTPAAGVIEIPIVPGQLYKFVIK